jgi:hypothetical protein
MMMLKLRIAYKMKKTILFIILGLILLPIVGASSLQNHHESIGVNLLAFRSGSGIDVTSSGDFPTAPGDSKICESYWICGQSPKQPVKWGKCKDGIETVILDASYPNWPDHYCELSSALTDTDQQVLCNFLSPSNTRGCFQAESFPFFTGWNVLGVIVLLAGFYVWNRKK